jgi:hypothetical protein
MSSGYNDDEDEADKALLAGGTSSSGEPTESSKGSVSCSIVEIGIGLMRVPLSPYKFYEGYKVISRPSMTAFQLCTNERNVDMRVQSRKQGRENADFEGHGGRFMVGDCQNLQEETHNCSSLKTLMKRLGRWRFGQAISEDETASNCYRCQFHY